MHLTRDLHAAEDLATFLTAIESADTHRDAANRTLVARTVAVHATTTHVVRIGLPPGAYTVAGTGNQEAWRKGRETFVVADGAEAPIPVRVRLESLRLIGGGNFAGQSECPGIDELRPLRDCRTLRRIHFTNCRLDLGAVTTELGARIVLSAHEFL